MSGHSHWATIKHKKEKEDAKRGKVFTKIIKEITVAAKTGGGDPSGNPRLRDLIDKAKEANMPQENIQRAIKKGTGELPGVVYEEHTYEGYGPGGIAVIVETLSDNNKRTVADLRHLFSKNGGNLGESGSVSWMFEKLGVTRVTTNNLTEDTLMELLLDYDIKDITGGSDFFQVTCSPKELAHVKAAIKDAGHHVESADIEWIAQNNMALTGDAEKKAIDFLSALEELDDVQNVYTNLG